MTIRYMRLAFALFFLIMGVVLLVLRFGLPDLVARLDPLRLFLGAVLALVLAGWNLMKWYSSWMAFRQQATPIRRPLQRNRLPNADAEPNPDFDFSKDRAPSDKQND